MDMLFHKVPTNNLWSALSTPEIASDIFQHLCFILGPAFAHRVALHILIEEFIRIQFGAVSRQEEHLDRIDVGKKPARDFSGPVYWMPVRDQENSTTSIVLDQSSKELDKHVGGELFFKDHKIQMALVGNGRYHVAAEAPSRRPNRSWPLPPWPLG